MVREMSGSVARRKRIAGLLSYCHPKGRLMFAAESLTHAENGAARLVFVQCFTPLCNLGMTIRLIEKLRAVESQQMVDDKNMNR